MKIKATIKMLELVEVTKTPLSASHLDVKHLQFIQVGKALDAISGYFRFHQYLQKSYLNEHFRTYNINDDLPKRKGKL